MPQVKGFRIPVDDPVGPLLGLQASSQQGLQHIIQVPTL